MDLKSPFAQNSAILQRRTGEVATMSPPRGAEILPLVWKHYSFSSVLQYYTKIGE